jgi:Ca2+/Na+ antiporter
VAGVGVNSDVGVGTIVGSAMFNILIIVAMSAVLAGKTLYLDWKPLCRDAFAYSISIVLLVGFSCMGWPAGVV